MNDKRTDGNSREPKEMKGGEARDGRIRKVSITRTGEGASVVSEKFVGDNLDELPVISLPFLPIRKPPEVLYHYTNAAGLEGILRNQALWATNYSFLNDPTEVSYGYDLACQILKKRNQAKSIDALKNDLKESLSEVYTCSFSQRYDDLSQWRAYGGGGAERYCIGFEREALYQASGPLPGNLDLQQVIYNKRQQRQILGILIDKVLTARQHKGNQNPVKLWFRLIFSFLPRLKSHAFHAEEEWRLIHWASPEEEAEEDCIDKICFDVSRGMVRPYVKIAFKPRPIVKLLVLAAPGREQVSVKAATMLLRRHDLKDVEVIRSTVPFVG